MSDPTWAEAWAQAKATINQLQKLHLFCNSNSPNWLGLEDTLIQALEGEYIQGVLSGAKADRAALSAILSPQSVARRLTPHLFEIARVAGIPERDPAAIMPKLRDYMIANGYSVQERNINFPTITAGGGNVGNGLIRRLVVDKDAKELEGLFMEAKTAICRLDQNQVQKHAEVFEFRGVEAEQDYLAVLGSGMSASIAAVNAGANGSQRFIQNPSFETYTGTAPTAGSPSTPSSTTQITGWTLTSAANARVLLDTPSPYRGYPGDGVASGTSLYAVRFSDNNKIVQTPGLTVKPTWNPDTPYWMQVAVYRESNCDGNIILRFGNTSRTVAMSGLTNSAWNVVGLTLDDDLWYQTFKEADLTIEVELASRTTGSCVIDDVIISPFTNVDGSWYIVVGGSTPFLYNDTFTWTDALTGSDAVVQYWWWRAGWGYLPASSTPTITDPT